MVPKAAPIPFANNKRINQQQPQQKSNQRGNASPATSEKILIGGGRRRPSAVGEAAATGGIVESMSVSEVKEDNQNQRPGQRIESVAAKNPEKEALKVVTALEKLEATRNEVPTSGGVFRPAVRRNQPVEKQRRLIRFKSLQNKFAERRYKSSLAINCAGTSAAAASLQAIPGRVANAIKSLLSSATGHLGSKATLVDAGDELVYYSAALPGNNDDTFSGGVHQKSLSSDNNNNTSSANCKVDEQPMPPPHAQQVAVQQRHFPVSLDDVSRVVIAPQTSTGTSRTSGSGTGGSFSSANRNKLLPPLDVNAVGKQGQNWRQQLNSGSQQQLQRSQQDLLSHQQPRSNQLPPPGFQLNLLLQNGGPSTLEQIRQLYKSMPNFSEICSDDGNSDGDEVAMAFSMLSSGSKKPKPRNSASHAASHRQQRGFSAVVDEQSASASDNEGKQAAGSDSDYCNYSGGAEQRMRRLQAKKQQQQLRQNFLDSSKPKHHVTSQTTNEEAQLRFRVRSNISLSGASTNQPQQRSQQQQQRIDRNAYNRHPRSDAQRVPNGRVRSSSSSANAVQSATSNNELAHKTGGVVPSLTPPKKASTTSASSASASASKNDGCVGGMNNLSLSSNASSTRSAMAAPPPPAPKIVGAASFVAIPTQVHRMPTHFERTQPNVSVGNKKESSSSASPFPLEQQPTAQPRFFGSRRAVAVNSFPIQFGSSSKGIVDNNDVEKICARGNEQLELQNEFAELKHRRKNSLAKVSRATQSPPLCATMDSPHVAAQDDGIESAASSASVTPSSTTSSSSISATIYENNNINSNNHVVGSGGNRKYRQSNEKAQLARTTSNGLKSSDSEHMTDNGRTEVSNENDDEEKYSPTDSGYRSRRQTPRISLKANNCSASVLPTTTKSAEMGREMAGNSVERDRDAMALTVFEPTSFFDEDFAEKLQFLDEANGGDSSPVLGRYPRCSPSPFYGDRRGKDEHLGSRKMSDHQRHAGKKNCGDQQRAENVASLESDGGNLSRQFLMPASGNAAPSTAAAGGAARPNPLTSAAFLLTKKTSLPQPQQSTPPSFPMDCCQHQKSLSSSSTGATTAVTSVEWFGGKKNVLKRTDHPQFAGLPSPSMAFGIAESCNSNNHNGSNEWHYPTAADDKLWENDSKGSGRFVARLYTDNNEPAFPFRDRSFESLYVDANNPSSSMPKSVFVAQQHQQNKREFQSLNSPGMDGAKSAVNKQIPNERNASRRTAHRPSIADSAQQQQQQQQKHRNAAAAGYNQKPTNIFMTSSYGNSAFGSNTKGVVAEPVGRRPIVCYGALGEGQRSALDDALRSAVAQRNLDAALRLRDEFGVPWTGADWVRALECMLDAFTSSSTFYGGVFDEYNKLSRQLPILLQDFEHSEPALAAAIATDGEQLGKFAHICFGAIFATPPTHRFDARRQKATMTVSGILARFISSCVCRRHRTKGRTPTTSIAESARGNQNANRSFLQSVNQWETPDERTSDVRFRFGSPSPLASNKKEMVHAHRIVLVNASEQFRSLLRSPAGVIDMPSEIRPEIFRLMLKYVYGNELNGIVSDLLRHIPSDVETPIQVLECAQRFGIFQLKMAIAEHCLTEAINAKNWMRIHSTAMRFGVPTLAEDCELFALRDLPMLLVNSASESKDSAADAEKSIAGASLKSVARNLESRFKSVMLSQTMFC